MAVLTVLTSPPVALPVPSSIAALAIKANLYAAAPRTNIQPHTATHTGAPHPSAANKPQMSKDLLRIPAGNKPGESTGGGNAFQTIIHSYANDARLARGSRFSLAAVKLHSHRRAYN